MLALRLLLLFTCIGTNASIFEATYSLSDTQSNNYISEDAGFYGDFNPFFNNPELKTEIFSHEYSRLTPKVVYAFWQAKKAISNRKQLEIGIQYLKYSHVIDLKLNSHSISYPFHSFP